jgi:crotonobetainyl-CoA:carnitine CoA-transferase CaiB-like acyl-CoA transferase
VTGALSGVVVADFSRVLSGPLATMLLGDLGADVIKVEHPDGGDDTRAWGPPFVDGTSSYYLSANRNKRSVICDLRSDQGKQVALGLIDRADVLVENFRPGTMDRLGLGYDQVNERNPELVYCSISGFGSGKGRDLPGYDFLVQAVGGLMSITGPEGGEPQKVGVALVDVLTGLHAVIGILAALHERGTTGRGQRVELNLLSSLLASLVNQGSSYATAGVVPRSLGNRHPSIVPYESMRGADRSFVVAVGNDKQFRALCSALGLSSLTDEPRFARNAQRVEHREALLAVLAPLFRMREAAYWVELLDEAGVPCGLVNNLPEAYALGAELGLEPLVHIAGDGDQRSVTQLANPITLSAAPVSYRRPPPRHGEHTQDVLDWLATTRTRMAAGGSASPGAEVEVEVEGPVHEGSHHG